MNRINKKLNRIKDRKVNIQKVCVLKRVDHHAMKSNKALNHLRVNILIVKCCLTRACSD